MKKIALTLFLLFLGAASWAQQGIKTQTVSIFKNSTGFFVKSGSVKPQGQHFVLVDSLPAPLLGTYWFFSGTDQIVSVISRYQEIVKVEKSVNYEQLLKSNIGKSILLKMKYDTTHYRGKIESVEGKILSMLSKENRWFFCKVEEIDRFQFLDKPSMDFQDKIQKPTLSVEFATKKAEQQLSMIYLQKDISWTPTYLIELVDDTKAMLKLQAEVVNDAEDIINATIDFVVGVPNFAFAADFSPMYLMQKVSSYYMDELEMSNNEYQYLGYSYSGKLREENEDEKILDKDKYMPSPETFSLDGKSEEDLFFYSLKKTTLLKGSRGFFDILRIEVPVEHIYESIIPYNRPGYSGYAKEFLFNEANKVDVFHSLKITNNSKTPLTTGAAMLVKADESRTPISQDKLSYTPAGASSYVKITSSPDIKVKYADREKTRNEKAKRIKGEVFDLVEIESQIVLKNYKDKAVKMNIKRLLIGEVGESNVEWKVEKKLNYNEGPNLLNEALWDFTLGAGEEKTITYTYKVYIPSV